MKKFIIIIYLFVSSSGFAQKNQYGTLNVISHQEYNFYLYIDSIKINQEAQSTIRIEDLSDKAYLLRLEFDNPEHTVINRKNVFVSSKTGEMLDVTYELINEENTIKLVFLSKSSSKINKRIPENVFTYNFENKQQTNIKTAVVVNAMPKANTASVAKKDSVIKPLVTTMPDTKNIISPAPVFKIKEPGNWVCQNEWPMWKSEYETAKKSIQDEKSDAQKLKIAKSLAIKNCMTSEQVAEIGSLLISEATKLDFSKFAFNHTIDIKNYLKVEKIFSDEKSKSIFENFITP